jgi:hypothetical protein
MRKSRPDSQTSLSAASACPQEAGRKLAPTQTFFLFCLTCELTVPRCCQHSRSSLASYSALQDCQGCICAAWSHLEIAFVKEKCVLDSEVFTARKSSGMLEHHIPKDLSCLKLNAVIKDCTAVCNKRQVL